MARLSEAWSSGVSTRPSARMRSRTPISVVAIGVEIADGDSLDLVALEPGDGAIERGMVERRLDPTVGAHALTHAEPPRARHQRLGRRHAQIVTVVLQPLAHLQYVAMTVGGQQPDLRAFVLEQ